VIHDLADDLALALRLADAADAVSGPAFTGLAVAHEIKADGSPVSAADLAVERRISEIVAAERPGDGVLGEEVGESGSRGRRWIIDGIDGTVLFVDGRRGWATEIALEVDGEPVIGVTTAPADGRRWWAARGAGAWCAATAPGDGTGPDGGGSDGARSDGARSDGDATPVPLHVSATTALDGGSCSTIPPRAVLVGRSRGYGDLLAAHATYVAPHEHGALFVADGRVDVCLQTGGGPWDFAALSVIVEEAGGRFSDLQGRRDIYGGGPVVFSNGRVHDATLAALTA
jgi:histidinol-phosphatase